MKDRIFLMFLFVSHLIWFIYGAICWVLLGIPGMLLGLCFLVGTFIIGVHGLNKKEAEE